MKGHGHAEQRWSHSQGTQRTDYFCTQIPQSSPMQIWRLHYKLLGHKYSSSNVSIIHQHFPFLSVFSWKASGVMEMSFPLIVSNTCLSNSRIQCPHQPLRKLVHISTTASSRFPSSLFSFHSYIIWNPLETRKEKRKSHQKKKTPNKTKLSSY